MCIFRREVLGPSAHHLLSSPFLLPPCVPFFLSLSLALALSPFFLLLPLPITHRLLLLPSSFLISILFFFFTSSPHSLSPSPFLLFNTMSLSLAAAIPRTSGRWVCSLSATRQRLFHSAAATRAAASPTQHLQTKPDYSQYGKVTLSNQMLIDHRFFYFSRRTTDISL